MDKLLFLDVEATGVDAEDRLIQVACRVTGGIAVNEFFKPPVPIKIPAMAVHHVTEKMIADKEAFKGSQTEEYLIDLFNQKYIFVAHNAKYDIGMLEKEGVFCKDYIDTLKVARYLDDGQFENHQLQYLRYFYGIEVEADAHDAMGDITVLEALFWRLVGELMHKEPTWEIDDAIGFMITISLLPSKFKKFNFGKYYGATIEEVKAGGFDGKGLSWMQWILGEKKNAPEGQEDWIYTLEEALK